MVEKGRANGGPINTIKGEDHWSAKLAETDAELIRHLYENRIRFSVTQYSLAYMFGISQATVSRIVQRRV